MEARNPSAGSVILSEPKCMDYHHHHLVSHHRTMMVEAPVNGLEAVDTMEVNSVMIFTTWPSPFHLYAGSVILSEAKGKRSICFSQLDLRHFILQCW